MSSLTQNLESAKQQLELAFQVNQFSSAKNMQLIFEVCAKKSYSDTEKKEKKYMDKNILEIKDEIKVNMFISNLVFQLVHNYSISHVQETAQTR